MEKSIEEIIKCIINLLRENDEPEWAEIFSEVALEYNNNETRNHAVKKVINFYKGGMGSFSDLVLQKNMKMLIEENDELADLKHDLFNKCLIYSENKGIS